MVDICWFSEMHCHSDNGSIKDFICDSVDYDKDAVIEYLSDAKKRFAICPRIAIDCITGEQISTSFSAYNDGEFCWADFLVYHIKKYNIRLPEKFLDKIKSNNGKNP